MSIIELRNSRVEIIPSPVGLISLKIMCPDCSPPIIKNVKVRDKNGLLHDKAISEKIAEIEKGLGSEGRVVVRPSGTEPLVRIMVEAVDADKAKSTVRDIYSIIRKYEDN